jgi:hypothetical protein
LPFFAVFFDATFFAVLVGARLADFLGAAFFPAFFDCSVAF